MVPVARSEAAGGRAGWQDIGCGGPMVACGQQREAGGVDRAWDLSSARAGATAKGAYARCQGYEISPHTRANTAPFAQRHATPPTIGGPRRRQKASRSIWFRPLPLPFPQRWSQPGSSASECPVAVRIRTQRQSPPTAQWQPEPLSVSCQSGLAPVRNVAGAACSDSGAYFYPPFPSLGPSAFSGLPCFRSRPAPLPPRRPDGAALLAFMAGRVFVINHSAARWRG